jgi:hypothetical protein
MSSTPAGSNAVSDCRCNPGYTGPDGSTCSACMAGTYKTSAGSAVCLDCENGKYSHFSATECTQCGTGNFSNNGAPLCMPCDAGKYTTNHVTCLDCVAGKYSILSACVVCDNGKYSTAPKGSIFVGSSACYDCAAGKYLSYKGASTEQSCAWCPPNADSAAGSAICNRNAGYTGNEVPDHDDRHGT